MLNASAYFLAAFAVFIIVAGIWQQSGRAISGLRYVCGLFVVGFFGFWLFLAVHGKSWAFRVDDSSRWLVPLMFSLFIVGLAGILASVLSAIGPLRLSHSREWPAGYVRGVITTGDGKHVVPLWPSGRVQLYDSQWHFIRGWNVDAWGGVFKVQCSSDGMIEVLTARGDRLYRFTDEGQLVSSEPLARPISLWITNGRSVMVPTPIALWVFSSPILSGAVALIGFVGINALRQ
jgi:hypothetical protein